MPYLDWAATALTEFYNSDYGYNQYNSNAAYAISERHDLQQARDKIMKALCLTHGYVLFCHNATHAAEILAQRFNGTIICSPFEHSSVYDLFAGNGPKGDLFLHQMVNQVTGKIFNLEHYVGACDDTRMFGSDITAAIGHIELPPYVDKMDALWYSGHKIGTEPGIGVLWVSERLFDNLGGNPLDSRNEYGLVHGTLNIGAARAIAWATYKAVDNVRWNVGYWGKLRNIMYRELTEAGIEYFTPPVDDTTPAINAITFKHINTDALATYLQTHNVYIGVGHSACEANADYHELMAQGYNLEEAEHTVRVSFGPTTNERDIQTFVNYVVEFNKKFVEGN